MAGSIRIVGTGQLIDLSRRLRRAGGPRLQQNLGRRVRRAAEPLRTDLQRAILGVQMPGPGRTKRGGPSPTRRPLRQNIAGAVRISVRQGTNPTARVWIDRGRLPADMRNMPWTIESGRVRHPVFGNRRRWVTQWARPAGWWSRTVAADTPRMRAEVERILGDVRRDLQ